MAPFHAAPLFTLHIFFWEKVPILCPTDNDRELAPGAPPPDLPILFFDGECAMCNRTVKRMLKLDPSGVFRFAPLEGETARGLIPEASRVRDVDSVVLLDDDGLHVRSECVLRSLSRLGGLWRVSAAVMRVVPRPLRDVIYDFVASRRKRWFGRVESCALISEAERARVLP